VNYGTPSLHDNHLVGYEVDGEAATVVLHTKRVPAVGDVRVDVVFTGVVAYDFEGDCLVNVVSDIEVLDPEAVPDETLVERHQRYGWPSGWDPDRETASAWLRRLGARVFRLHCSYGMGGWVAAESMTVHDR
jgi:hypothetical protein